jgi:POT family proton-dependent oligopeptide transporter
MTAPATTEPATTPSGDLFGHPRGLTVLFASEMWERFSYYGNAALVVLYMVKYLFDPVRIETVIGIGAVRGALEFVFGPLDPQPFAAQLFGFYSGLAYFMPVVGGLVADRWLGQRRTVILGGVLMAIGHFLMAFEALFLLALTFLILGIGGFKPNISTQVGALYAPGDRRRERAYAIFYVGINIGAFLAPLICGTLAAAFGWHYGFAAAGVGMLISLGIYLGGQRTLPADHVDGRGTQQQAANPLDPHERYNVRALLFIAAAVLFFWAAYDQQVITILLWADDFTERGVNLGFWQGEIPAVWFLSLNPLMIFVLTPFLVRLWAEQSRRGREPPALRKMAFGCACLTAAYLLLAVAASFTGKASPFWLLGYFAIATLGELCLAPVGLALVIALAPVRMRSMLMGAWFATTLPADILAGYLGGFWTSMPKTAFFLMIAAVAAVAAIAFAVLSRVLRLRPSG